MAPEKAASWVTRAVLDAKPGFVAAEEGASSPANSCTEPQPAPEPAPHPRVSSVLPVSAKTFC